MEIFAVFCEELKELVMGLHGQKELGLQSVPSSQPPFA